MSHKNPILHFIWPQIMFMIKNATICQFYCRDLEAAKQLLILQAGDKILEMKWKKILGYFPYTRSLDVPLKIKLKKLEKRKCFSCKDNLSKEAIKNPLQQKKKVRKNNLSHFWRKDSGTAEVVSCEKYEFLFLLKCFAQLTIWISNIKVVQPFIRSCI